MRNFLFFASGIILIVVILVGCQNKTKIDEQNLDEITVKNQEDQVTEDDFTFRLVSEKTEYSQDEPIELYAEIIYHGDLDKVSIVHSSSPVFFNLTEQVRDFQIDYAVNDIGITTELKRNEPMHIQYEKSGGFSDNDDKVFIAFMEEFLQEENFPVGHYLVNGLTDIAVGEPEEEKEQVNIKAQIEFKVKK